MSKALQSVTPNGPDPPLDPAIVKMVEFLDRAIRSQNVTVGVVIAAIGVILGRQVTNVTRLDDMVKEVSIAIRVGFFFQNNGKRRDTK